MVRQADELILSRLLEFQAGEGEFRHLGQRVEQHRLAHAVAVQPQNRVPAAGRTQRPHQDGVHQDEGLARTGAAEQQDVTARTGEQAERFPLRRRFLEQLCHGILPMKPGQWLSQ